MILYRVDILNIYQELVCLLSKSQAVFFIDLLNITCVSGLGIKFGTNRCKLSNITLVIVANDCGEVV